MGGLALSLSNELTTTDPHRGVASAKTSTADIVRGAGPWHEIRLGGGLAPGPCRGAAGG